MEAEYRDEAKGAKSRRCWPQGAFAFYSQRKKLVSCPKQETEKWVITLGCELALWSKCWEGKQGMELGRGGEVPTEAQGGPEGGWTRGFWHEGRAWTDQHGAAMRSG